MVILIDNYDSFTYNLVHLIGEEGISTTILRNDQYTTEEILNRKPSHIVISPGPCDPDKAGICLELIRAAAVHKIPLLGVCLGHQALGQAFGAKIVRAPEPIHGKVDRLKVCKPNALFQGIDDTFEATRYHSLVIERSTLSDEFRITAETFPKTPQETPLIMAIEHKTLPMAGLQFHPESIRTQHGHLMIRNFFQWVNQFPAPSL
jgi:anthranilate synthase component II